MNSTTWLDTNNNKWTCPFKKHLSRSSNYPSIKQINRNSRLTSLTITSITVLILTLNDHRKVTKSTSFFSRSVSSLFVQKYRNTFYIFNINFYFAFFDKIIIQFSTKYNKHSKTLDPYIKRYSHKIPIDVLKSSIKNLSTYLTCKNIHTFLPVFPSKTKIRQKKSIPEKWKLFIN